MDRRIAALVLALIAASAVWLLQDLPNAWRFVLGLRAEKLAGLVLVGASVGVSTVLFQTVAANRILTPQIMGFDALFALLQTGLVAALGVTGFAILPAPALFATQAAAMTGAAMLLFSTLLRRGAQDIARMILTGVILGVLFRSLSSFLERLMDPNSFAVVQSVTRASFGRIDAGLLPIAAVVSGAAIAVAFALSGRLDIMALGRPVAISLGLQFERMVLLVLALVAVLVAVSTALVGPVAFFGLLVAGLAQAIAGTMRHRLLLPAAALTGALILVCGQWFFERVMGQQATLAVVVEFAGGIMFLTLLLKGRIR